MPRKNRLVSNYMRMWPREIFDREDVEAILIAAMPTGNSNPKLLKVRGT